MKIPHSILIQMAVAAGAASLASSAYAAKTAATKAGVKHSKVVVAPRPPVTKPTIVNGKIKPATPTTIRRSGCSGRLVRCGMG